MRSATLAQNVPVAAVPLPAIGSAIAPEYKAVRAGVLLALLAIGYYFAVKFGLGFRFHNSQIGVVWPANGILLAALVLTRRRHWWPVLLTTALVHAAVMLPVVPAWRWAWQILGNAGFTIATVELLRRLAGLPLHFGDRRQVFAYTTLAFAMPAIYGLTTASFVRSVLHLESTYSPSAALLRTLLSNATGLLLIAPVVILGAQYGMPRVREWRGRRIAEAAVMVTSLLTMGAIAFGTGPHIAQLPSLLLWIVPPLLWAAVRFGPLGAATSLFAVAALSIWGTAHRLGPFVLIADADHILSLQLFWIVLSVPLLLLAAVIRERDMVAAVLEEQYNQLAHVTRVATVGELSGALAHELRQPLMSILANAQAGSRFLAAQPPALDQVRDILQDIADQDRHAANVISGVQLFLKKGQPRFQSLELETVVRDALALSRNAISLAAVEVQTQFAADLPRVRGDPIQLLQVTLNLIVNACEAMKHTPALERRLRLQIANAAGHVELMIADCGVGLPPQEENVVFEPFFTTKEKGLGLGLTIGRTIARAHGGRLWGENNSQGGATFHLVLPADRGNGYVATHQRG